MTKRFTFDLNITATEIEEVAKQYFDLPATSSLVKEGDNGIMNGMDILAKGVDGDLFQCKDGTCHRVTYLEAIGSIIPRILFST